MNCSALLWLCERLYKTAMNVLFLDHKSSVCALQFMASAMQGAYLPQYAHMQTASLPLEVSGGNVVLASCWEHYASIQLHIFALR